MISLAFNLPVAEMHHQSFTDPASSSNEAIVADAEKSISVARQLTHHRKRELLGVECSLYFLYIHEVFSRLIMRVTK